MEPTVISDQDLPLARTSLPFSHGRGMDDTDTIRTASKKEEMLYRQQGAPITQNCSIMKMPGLVCPLKLAVGGGADKILCLTLVAATWLLSKSVTFDIVLALVF